MKEETPDYAGSEDALLMARVARGDDQALAALIERWQRPILNFFYRSLQSTADAEDFAQAVFIKLHRAAPRYTATARFSTYLFHIARRVLLNEFRRRGRKPVDLVAPEDLPGGTTSGGELRILELEEIFQNCLERMPENHRTAILLLKQQELSYAEIAEIMETTEGMVKTWIFRARTLLREELKKIV
jgi:RNA polymerase sigma-70 factor, ECF subfamily